MLKTLSKEEKLEYMRRRWGVLEETKCDAVIVPTEADETEELHDNDAFGEFQRRNTANIINSDEL
jgi:hypothetical protein